MLKRWVRKLVISALTEEPEGESPSPTGEDAVQDLLHAEVVGWWAELEANHGAPWILFRDPSARAGVLAALARRLTKALDEDDAP